MPSLPANSMARMPTTRCEPPSGPGSLQPWRSTCRQGRGPNRSRTSRSFRVHGLLDSWLRRVKFGSWFVWSGRPVASKSSLFRASSRLFHVRKAPLMEWAKLRASSDVYLSGTWCLCPSRLRYSVCGAVKMIGLSVSGEGSGKPPRASRLSCTSLRRLSMKDSEMVMPSDLAWSATLACSSLIASALSVWARRSVFVERPTALKAHSHPLFPDLNRSISSRLSAISRISSRRPPPGFGVARVGGDSGGLARYSAIARRPPTPGLRTAPPCPSLP
mmetsp:Transcript_47256/g.133255  ORF Transcript_47256/g.133255 Transcript_47256/m.133255 type:complete len:274 (+) Transcript_47256:760-1581(+)